MATLMRSALLRAGAVAAVVLAACGDDTGASKDDVAQIYTVAIQWLVGDARTADGAERETAFVEPVREDGIPLEVQADVVNLLDDELTVRFIDTRGEALDTSEPADPVRDEGVLIGLGPVGDDPRSPVRLYADRYLDIRDVVAYELVVERRGGRWQLMGEPRSVAVDDADRARRD